MPTHLSFVLFLLQDSVMVFIQQVNAHTHTHRNVAGTFHGWVHVGGGQRIKTAGRTAIRQTDLRLKQLVTNQHHHLHLQDNRMLCPSVIQMSPATMTPFLDLHWPVRSLWPETRPLFYHIEREMIRHMQEMKQSIEFMERLHQKIFEEIDQTSSCTGVFKPIAFQELGRDGTTFALSLDTKEFSPEELSVKQVGRKLRVSGRTEKKQEDGKGCYTYKCQEFRQEFDLPDGVDPEAVTCSLLGGQLQIQPRPSPPPPPALEQRGAAPPPQRAPPQRKTEASQQSLVCSFTGTFFTVCNKLSSLAFSDDSSPTREQRSASVSLVQLYLPDGGDMELIPPPPH
uniref:SHSP domain-containing protein n=1 Tax=Astatotilapia calliptera TaxID=8154 RepID=A0AAX7VT31_ASTCA